MSQESIKKIYDWLERLDEKLGDNNRRLQRIELVILGGEDEDFDGHKQRLKSVETHNRTCTADRQKLHARINRIYYTSAGILIIVTLIVALL